MTVVSPAPCRCHSIHSHLIRKLIEIARDNSSTAQNIRTFLYTDNELSVPLVCRMFDVVDKLQSNFRGLLRGLDLIALVTLYQYVRH